jgi:hypothetical protein
MKRDPHITRPYNITWKLIINLERFHVLRVAATTPPRAIEDTQFQAADEGALNLYRKTTKLSTMVGPSH